MENLPYLPRRRIFYHLSSKDLEALAQVCWFDDVTDNLNKRRKGDNNEPVKFIQTFIKEGDSFDGKLETFLTEISWFIPSLALIYVPREIDRSRRVWIENIFPSSVSGIKLQFRIFTDFELGAGDKDLTMQALLVFDNNIFRTSLILLREFEDGSTSQFLLHTNGNLEDVLETKPLEESTNLSSFACFVKVPKEMVDRTTRMGSITISGVNFVTYSHISPSLYRSKQRFHGLKRIRKEFINGFIMKSLGNYSLNLEIKELSTLHLPQTAKKWSQKTCLVIPQKVEDDYLEIPQHLLPTIFRGFLGWSQRLTVNTLNYPNRKINRRTEVLVVSPVFPKSTDPNF
ncbi:uncharacterized protein LOC111699144 [Eurytemora carolleeae]|uniref:uncharacterized protein LOC111699144 n=1 Tax=Eurytemora carolleeae TaxID=1294199 RepID=UPI000C76493D|nr:uncharacterized protein LOC111699144 [Eurytemora carolleeae]XP_023325501.1 uncharacterized protein LOC111699144 [Eurytemora carolleeae]XP_023325502.1 uncharacterized protein LOC111699144 [Eurytemora carolleeae]|eukprot:XP_023325499.1 uncharacterized protein LOC111699144 [Eurytemora affinis]